MESISVDNVDNFISVNDFLTMIRVSSSALKFSYVYYDVYILWINRQLSTYEKRPVDKSGFIHSYPQPKRFL